MFSLSILTESLLYYRFLFLEYIHIFIQKIKIKFLIVLVNKLAPSNMISSAPMRSVSLEVCSIYSDDDSCSIPPEGFSFFGNHGRMVLMGPYDECGSPTCLEYFIKNSDTLQARASQIVAKIVNKHLFNIESIEASAKYLEKLSSKPLNYVIQQLSLLRPRFLPLEYHWAPTEKDPFLTLIQKLPSVTAIMYIPHPLCQPHLENLFTIHKKLVALSLTEFADDSLLRIVGSLCLQLSYIDVSRSKGVTDCGLRRLLLKAPTASRFHWRQLYRRWKELRTTAASSPAYRPLFLSNTTSSLESTACHTPICSSLRHLDLRGTRTSAAGAEWAARRLEAGSHILLTPIMTRNNRRLRSHNEEVRQSLLGEV